MDNCTYHLENTLTSFSHANFKLDIFYSKTLLYSFWERENGLKADKKCKIFSHLKIYLHNHIFIYLHIAYEHIYCYTRYVIFCHECQGSCTSVEYIQLVVKFCLIVYFFNRFNWNSHIFSNYEQTFLHIQ